jgi:flagellin-like protein
MKMLRSRKALSPVVASIILIAVTVAVSIAVAAWMGALTFNFMATEQGQLTNLIFVAGASGSGNITVTFQNTGTTPIVINEVWVNNAIQTQTNVNQTLPYPVKANSVAGFVITTTVNLGYQYEVKFVSSKGNAFPRTGTAPT